MGFSVRYEAIDQDLLIDTRMHRTDWRRWRLAGFHLHLHFSSICLYFIYFTFLPSFLSFFISSNCIFVQSRGLIMVCIAFALFQSFIFLFPLHSLSKNLFNFFVC